MSLLHRLICYLQDAEKVARFQKLCGVEALPDWRSVSSAQTVDAEPPLANGNCTAAKPQGESGRRRGSPGSWNTEEKHEESHSNGMKNGMVSEDTCGVESQPASLEKRKKWVSKSHPRRNSLTGESISQKFRIHNFFLYYLFSFGTELGNEFFYMVFFSFCFWNVDPWLGRRLIIIWVWIMYFGQCTKDIIRWPRPASPPVVKLEVFYNSEYSMPSTHAMAGTAIPVSLFLLSYGQWQYPFIYGLILAICWSSLVCFSRVYMGMHTVLDVIAGFLYALLILVVFLPTVDLVDNFNLTFKYAPLVIVSIHLALGVFSFTLDTWSTSRGDTAQILGSGAGIACGSYATYRLNGMLDPSPEMLPLVPTLTLNLFGKAALRLLIGLVFLLLVRMIMKKITIPLACKVFGISSADVREARQHMEVELPYRYITYGTMGFSVTFLVPFLFCLIGLSTC
ncbi:sphingosine-1-phosphate phosphatase 1 [Pantherophis guttatus]|uniref:Sphingosine-1-phosphate phosphatase 1 n=1 Tax=Pantherophis guttatus TaxID=94885 RepID=A0A6P9DB68_PANGU|nr:sphingosine-1-phosphate phosphatase 1 [Pantherophis guttatus]